MTDISAPIAAIAFAKGESVDAVLAETAHRLSADGFCVEGFVQAEGEEGPDGHPVMRLVSLSDGNGHVISQALGRLSTGCRLDPAALTALCGPLLARLDDGVDFLVINRFAKGEAAGAGFRAAFEQAVVQGIPVITAIRSDWLADWEAFTGGDCEMLACEADAVLGWAHRQLRASGKVRLTA